MPPTVFCRTIAPIVATTIETIVRHSIAKPNVDDALTRLSESSTIDNQSKSLLTQLKGARLGNLDFFHT